LLTHTIPRHRNSKSTVATTINDTSSDTKFPLQSEVLLYSSQRHQCAFTTACHETAQTRGKYVLSDQGPLNQPDEGSQTRQQNNEQSSKPTTKQHSNDRRNDATPQASNQPRTQPHKLGKEARIHKAQRPKKTKHQRPKTEEDRRPRQTETTNTVRIRLFAGGIGYRASYTIERRHASQCHHGGPQLHSHSAVSQSLTTSLSVSGSDQ